MERMKQNQKGDKHPSVKKLKPGSTSASSKTKIHLWSREEVGKLIELVQKHYIALNDKISSKKSVWKLIFTELQDVCAGSLGQEMTYETTEEIEEPSRSIRGFRRQHETDRGQTNKMNEMMNSTCS